MATQKDLRRLKIKRGIRKKVYGTAKVPRLSVFKSNTSITAQLIDDDSAKTIIFASSRDISDKKNINIELSSQVGKKIAEKALENGIDSVIFDRNGYLYHGNIKALADGARAGGLKF